MLSFHRATFELLGTEPRTSIAAIGRLERTEHACGIRLPPSVREWYSNDDALPILAAHSNDDPPIPLREFSLTESTVGRLIPIRHENQGVCTWAILLDGSDDPPVLVEVDSDGTAWQPVAPRILHLRLHLRLGLSCGTRNQPAFVQRRTVLLAPRLSWHYKRLFV